MEASNFSDKVLAGGSAQYAREVEDIKRTYGFDFVGIGLTSFLGAPLKWVYSAGAADERHHRIVLAPGHGIGGIVIKAGKPMMFANIDEEIDPQEYSSYPIVFAEDLHGFCALPLTKKDRVVGALLCAFRTVGARHQEAYRRLINDLDGHLCDLGVVDSDFMDFDHIATERQSESRDSPLLVYSEVSRIIGAQEEERKKISRELHDGVAQELLSVSFLLKRLENYVDGDEGGQDLLSKTFKNLDRILDELHNISVQLRPSTLDHLGFVPALRSHAILLEKAYGTEIVFEGALERKRFDQALETQVFRICQEAILNACKYAGTDKVYVRLEGAGGWLHASILDYGGGFDIDKPVVKGTGCGLPGMQERAKLIGATLRISSSSKGTEVVLVAPMRAADRQEEVI